MLKLMHLIFGVTVFYASIASAQSCHGTGFSSALSTYSTQSKQSAESIVLQWQCPVMKNPISRTVFSDWEGDKNNTPKRVYFCCASCIEKFEKKPAKYILKLRRMNQQVENLKESK